MSSQPIQIWSNEDLKQLRKHLERLIYSVQVAKDSGADIQDVRAKLEEITQATNIRDAMILRLDADLILTEKVGNLGRISKLRFLGDLYGLAAVSWSVFCLTVFGLLLFFWQPIRSNLLSLAGSYGIPAWASIFAGMGASVQILVEVVGDIRGLGYVAKYRNLMYLTLPFVALVFGFMTYALIQWGILNFGGGSFTGYPSYLLCFLSGYATDWFMTLLKNLTPKITESTTVS